MRLSDTGVALLLVVPLIILVFSINIYPIAYSFWLSLNDVSLFKQTVTFVGLQQYAKAFADQLFANSVLVSVRFVIESVLLIMLSSIGIALVLNEKTALTPVLKVLVILPWALSEFAVAIAGRFFLDRNYGFLNALLLHLGLVDKPIYFLNPVNAVDWLAIFYAWNITPIGAYFILSALQTIPEDLYRQAQVDGASAFWRFRIITFPFIRYAVLITTVLATILSASSLVLAFALTGGGPGFASTPATLYSFRVFFNAQDFGYGAAMSWLLLIFVMIGSIFYFKLLTFRR
ncbi:multiple sugar ABC transporter permease [Candidatus Caldarchaeum subterraneum]|uniref:Inner membrane protein MalF n=1 Tax=Caldiarchaeum subterraneum TaxID=311458 RepID=E6N3Q6_CALS0|nr:inner membrane protein MalF [Candidatus Caldarchaeum subterraneum]BAJ47709.1 multiple sugar ABC transporter permease [Candidatus Caldarchaeum subterraneum]BAJ50525.1 multiple sugar ABC transporter permease [Candidatus Caldarchaeum subterraneum]